MEIWIREQFISAVASLVLGIATGAAYDALKITYALFGLDVRNMKRLDPRRIVVFLLDFLFCLAFSASYAIVTYAFSYGQFRLFMLLSSVAGFAAYAATVGRAVTFLTDRIVRLIRRAVGGVFRLIFIPVRLMGMLLKRCALALYRVTVGRVAKKIRTSCERRYTEKIMNELSSAVRFDT